MNERGGRTRSPRPRLPPRRRHCCSRPEGCDKSFYDAGREVRCCAGSIWRSGPAKKSRSSANRGSANRPCCTCWAASRRPPRARFCFEGQDLFALGARALAEFRNLKLGFVFQFHYLLADFTALENVMMPALIARQTEQEAARRAAEVLELVGLADKLHRRPAELSGGEQQRVAVARAVVLHPRLVLADEPTGNLDPQTADEVHQLFHLLNRELGITLVVATHNESLTRSMGRALRMREGHLIEERG